MDSPANKLRRLHVLTARDSSAGSQPLFAHSIENSVLDANNAKIAHKSRSISFGRNWYCSGLLTFKSRPLDPTNFVNTCNSIATNRGHNSSRRKRLRMSLSVFRYPNICRVLLHSGSACFTSLSLSSSRLEITFCSSSDRRPHSCVFAIFSCASRISGSFCMTVAISVFVSFMMPFANLMKEALFWVMARNAGRCSELSHKYFSKDEILARWLILS
mmetsp:Transcript_16496/g.46069  ORF Transcript_16496/g.46069 Transcript_16496/m.46069 type:complete len:216 (-) Transcript_16496:957-1604(-)